ncbi:hypothetical protein [Streptomyces gobiensis]|uniref:hypothetical protein n=1 Tax=Streptomyces gobiensis TaxID=2875706 RepID=UPI001E4589D7|nr:hypothetical protein [Streptomyces gobiensis]UGY91004.1 hypothetical protein test1122_04195 [Streptomyces gobiensis]
MIDTILPPLVAAAAITFTYFFCIRPMRQGRGCHMMPRQADSQKSSCCASSSAGDSTDREIRQLREEVQLFHHELDLHTADPVRLQKDDPR